MNDVFCSPLGNLYLRAEKGCITGLVFSQWVEPSMDDEALYIEENLAILNQCKAQLDEYFRGVRQVFDIRLGLFGTDFRLRVWDALMTIPYGHTESYSWIAKQIGKPLAVRAVGGANHNNPVSIIVPCHRVVGADGSLTGYGGGLELKKWLLDHEKHMAQMMLK